MQENMTQDDIISKWQALCLPLRQDMTPNTIAFFMSNGAKEVMRITADSVTVAPDVSVNEAAATVIAALKQHIKNIAAAEREACADICDQHASVEGIAQRCAEQIRARSGT